MSSRDRNFSMPISNNTARYSPRGELALLDLLALRGGAPEELILRDRQANQLREILGLDGTGDLAPGEARVLGTNQTPEERLLEVERERRLGQASTSSARPSPVTGVSDLDLLLSREGLATPREDADLLLSLLGVGEGLSAQAGQTIDPMDITDDVLGLASTAARRGVEDEKDALLAALLNGSSVRQETARDALGQDPIEGVSINEQGEFIQSADPDAPDLTRSQQIVRGTGTPEQKEQELRLEMLSGSSRPVTSSVVGSIEEQLLQQKISVATEKIRGAVEAGKDPDPEDVAFMQNPTLSPKDRSEIIKSTENSFDTRKRAIDKRLSFGNLKAEDDLASSVLAFENLSTESVKTIEKFDRNLVTTINTTNALIDQIERDGVPQFGSDRQAMQQQLSQLTLILAEMKNRGANFTDSEQEMIQGLAGNPGGFISRFEDPDEVVRRLKLFISSALKEADAIYSQGSLEFDLSALQKKVRLPNKTVMATFTDVNGRSVQRAVPLHEVPKLKERAKKSGGSLNVE